jgi:GMP synthase PP-ATPase subunit
VAEKTKMQRLEKCQSKIKKLAVDLLDKELKSQSCVLDPEKKSQFIGEVLEKLFSEFKPSTLLEGRKEVALRLQELVRSRTKKDQY